MFYIYYLALYFGMGVLFTFLSVYFAELTPLSPEQVTRMLSFAPIVSFLSQNTFAYISDKTRKHKPILIFVIIMTIAGALLVSWAASLNSFTITIIAYFIFAFFYPSVAALTENFTLEYASLNDIPYGRIRLFGSLGYAIAGQVAGMITGRYGVSVIFYIFALCSLVPLFIAPRFSSIEVDEEEEVDPTEDNPLITDNKVYSQLFKNKTYILIMLCSFFILGSMTVTNTIFGLYITQHAMLPLQFLGTTVLLSAATEIPMMFYSNKLIDKFGVYRILALAGILNAIRFMTYFLFPNEVAILVVTATHGIGYGSAFTAIMHLLEKEIPTSIRATAISFNTSFAVGIGTFAISFLSSLVLNARETYVLLALLQATGAVLCIYLATKNRSKKSKLEVSDDAPVVR